MLHPDLAFLQRPFTPDARVAKMHEVLDARAARFEAAKVPQRAP